MSAGCDRRSGLMIARTVLDSAGSMFADRRPNRGVGQCQTRQHWVSRPSHPYNHLMNSLGVQAIACAPVRQWLDPGAFGGTLAEMPTALFGDPSQPRVGLALDDDANRPCPSVEVEKG